MPVKKRINFVLFVALTTIAAVALSYYVKTPALAIFIYTQLAAFTLLHRVVNLMLFGESQSKKSLLWLFLAKSGLTIGPFIFVGIFYREILLWALFGYILVLLIFFISIKKDE